MFFKKSAPAEENKDLDLLLEAMNRIANGEVAEVDVTTFKDPKVGETFNKMISGYKTSTNKFTLALNNSMEIIGNSECIKEMIEQVENQTSSIDEMNKSSQALGDSINNISGAVENIIANANVASETAQKSAESMNKSIQVVGEATEAMKTISEMILSFKQKTDQINEIITIVKSIAKQSGLLALNASIEAARAGEAGKGFAVVANEVKELSNNTSASTEDVVKYVTELQSGIDELVTTINVTVDKIFAGNEMVANSVKDVNRINTEMQVINEEITSIYSSIETQSIATTSFVEGIGKLSDSYNELLEDCLTTGRLMHKISRSVDNCRSDMARQLSNLTRADWIRVFEIDHIIFTWRQYNSLQGYEILPRIQRADECKLGKWMAQQTDPRLTNSEAYKKLYYYHNQIHTKALDCWNATNAGHKPEALAIFNSMYQDLQQYLVYINQLKEINAKMEEEDAAKAAAATA